MLELQHTVATENRGFRRMFRPEGLSFGLFFPLEAYRGDQPVMGLHEQINLALRAESGGFSALWVRDIPLRDPNFRELGQVFDPWVWLAYIAAYTSDIALATGAIILPLRHPLHVAKAAASIDRLSGGRLVLGVAAGDRAVEFPAFNVPIESKAERFCEHLRVLQLALRESFPLIESRCGKLEGADLVPKPVAYGIPTLITGYCQQDLDWIAAHCDGWLNFARKPEAVDEPAALWRESTRRVRPGEFMPYAQPLFIDLVDDRACPPSPIHLGFRLGREALIEHLAALRSLGVQHVVFSLKHGSRPATEVVDELIEHVLPHFASCRKPVSASVVAA